MFAAFMERWHLETSSFHILIGEMSITLDDVSCVLHFPTRGRLLNHSKMFIPDALDMMVTYLGAEPGEFQIDNYAMRGAHARFSYMEKLYKYHLAT